MRTILMPLIQIANSTKLEDLDHIISCGLLQNLMDIATLPIDQMAERIQVSPSSLSRFIKKFELGSYSYFRNYVAEHMKSIWRNQPKYAKYQPIHSERMVVKDVIRHNIEAMLTMDKQIDERMILNVIDGLHNADHIYLLDQSNELGEVITEFQYRMALVDKVIYYCNYWMRSRSVEPNSMRLVPRIYRMDSELGNSVSINLVQRLPKVEGNLVDAHIFVWDALKIVKSDDSRISNESSTGKLMMSTVFEILYLAYYNKYVNDFNSI